MTSNAGVTPHRPPRVLILVENAPVPGDRRVVEEARSLQAAGCVVSVICPLHPGQSRRETFEGITVRRYRGFDARGGALAQGLEYLNALLKTFWLMLRLARRPGFDVIQACNPPDLLFLVVWPFKLAGKRFIFDQHDLSPELYSGLYSRDRGFLMWALRRSEHMSYRSADAVIVVNESYRRIALSRGGVDPDRLFTVRNGPRQNWPRPVPADPSLRRGRRYLVVYMGVMGRQDGVDVLLRVVDILVHEMGFSDIVFALVGSGNAIDELTALAHDLGIEDNVYFTGWLEDDLVLSSYLVTADACVCPEPSSPLNDHSTFIKVMEYMASGTPVVAFDLPETRESAGDAALYAARGDVKAFAELVRRALTDDGLRSKMSASAAARIPSLRWERQVPGLLAAYARALSGEDGRRVTGRLERRQEVPYCHEVEGYLVRVSEQSDDAAWDDFLEKAPTGHHAQTSRWGRARASIDWRPIRLVVWRDGEVVGGAQMVTRPMPFGGKVGFVHRGPVVPEGQPELAAIVFREVIAMGRACGVQYLVVQPPPGAHWMCGELKRRGFRYGAFDIDHTATLRLDLRSGLDNLLAQMARKRRQHIRFAAKSGVVVRRGSEADLAVFNHLKDLHSARLRYPRRNDAYYAEVWRALAPRGHVQLFVAEFEGKAVAAELAIPFGDTCRHMERPWSGEHAELRPNEALEWEVIRWASSEGYRFTDLEGIEAPVAEALLAGRQPPQSPENSASIFKIQYGGRVVVDPSSYDYVYNPVLRFAYRCVPTRLMRSAWMRRLLFKFRETGS